MKINRELFTLLKEEFVRYTSQFSSKDFFVQQHFEVKQQHTFRVCELIAEIGKKQGLNEELMLMAEISALFHDIGRFEQYHTYQSFSDMDSVNHSELGIQVMKEKNLLKDIDPEIKEIIYHTILNHNLPQLPEISNKETLMLSKLLRDADKLDVYRVVMDYDMQESKLQAEDEKNYIIPDNILNAFTRRQIVELRDAKSKFDFFLFRISWIFDINFPYSFQILDQKGYIQYFLKRIPKSYRLMNIQNTVKEYTVEKIFSYV